MTARLLKLTAMLPTGRCHITLSPVKNLPPPCGISSKFFDHLSNSRRESRLNYLID